MYQEFVDFKIPVLKTIANKIKLLSIRLATVPQGRIK
jgi:hypothetical protein